MVEIDTLPAYERRYFLRWIARAAEKYLKDPEVRKRYEAWEKEQAEKEQAEKEQAALKLLDV